MLVIFRKGQDRKRGREEHHLPDGNKYGDHVQYLQIYDLWQKNHFDIEWCKANGLQVSFLSSCVCGEWSLQLVLSYVFCT